MAKQKMKMTPEMQHKMQKVMGEFKSGKLLSSSGEKVTDRKQAIAIGLSEARKARKQVKKAQEGAIITAQEGMMLGPMGPGEMLPQGQAAPPPPDVIIETGADLVKAGLEELRAQGVFPPRGPNPVNPAAAPPGTLPGGPPV